MKNWILGFFNKFKKEAELKSLKELEAENNNFNPKLFLKNITVITFNKDLYDKLTSLGIRDIKINKTFSSGSYEYNFHLYLEGDNFNFQKYKEICYEGLGKNNYLYMKVYQKETFINDEKTTRFLIELEGLETQSYYSDNLEGLKIFIEEKVNSLLFEIEEDKVIRCHIPEELKENFDKFLKYFNKKYETDYEFLVNNEGKKVFEVYFSAGYRFEINKVISDFCIDFEEIEKLICKSKNIEFKGYF